MHLFRRLNQWYTRLFRKRRLSLRNETDNAEEWHMHISVARMLTGLLAFVLLVFLLVLSLAAYTPVLEFIPGYEANRSREMLLRNIMRLDSIERQMNQMRTYSDNVTLIMEGQTPVMPSLRTGDSIRRAEGIVMPSHEDSLLRAQMEGDGPYGLGQTPSRRTLREAMELLKPLEGIITQKFDLREGRYGVRIAATNNGAQVVAIDGGTVFLSLWSPEEGYMVGIQHAGNLLSIYKNLSQTMVSPGDVLRGGDIVGYSADARQENAEGKLFGFELWSDGKPVDPEGYIVF